MLRLRLLRTLLAAALASATTGIPLAAQPQLIPQPRELRATGSAPLRAGFTLLTPAAAADRFALRDLADALKERGVRTGAGGVAVSLLRSDSPAGRTALQRHGLTLDSAMRAEGYVLVATPTRVQVIAATPAGVFYGVQTLKQLVQGEGATARLQTAVVRDWPALRYRGWQDDLSRGPVPTLEFQKRQIRTLAAYKLNVFSPYFEHTLAYSKHPLLAPPGGALTPEQVRELVDYARQYHVDVIPEQEAFGHLHHVLKWETYAPLAETPHGHVLAPGQPGSLELIRDWFGELATRFPSRFVHLGADETFELGRGQTAERVRTEGIGPVYLGFLSRIVEMLRPSGKRFLFWGDVAMNHPELVKTLPKDLVAVAWSYGARDSFPQYLRPYAEAGLETWVAPGVSSWNRVYPNSNVALVNIRNFVRDGQRFGSTGMLNTSWDDDGEAALFHQLWYGLLFGAAAAWQPGESSIERFQQSYGRVFHGDTTGRVDAAQRKLMQAHALLRDAGLGDASTALFWLDPWSPEGQLAAQKIRPVARPLRLAAEEAIVLLQQARPAVRREREALDAMELGARQIGFIGMKFQFADDVARLYDELYRQTRDTAQARSTRNLADIAGVNGRLQDLRDGYSALRQLYEQAWLRENRPYWLPNVLARYDLATQLWVERIDRVARARAQFGRTRTLPPASEVGIPAPPGA